VWIKSDSAATDLYFVVLTYTDAGGNPQVRTAKVDRWLQYAYTQAWFWIPESLGKIVSVSVQESTALITFRY
jgi:hypothetical protein